MEPFNYLYRTLDDAKKAVGSAPHNPPDEFTKRITDIEESSLMKRRYVNSVHYRRSRASFPRLRYEWKILSFKKMSKEIIFGDF
jgi:hypothetical protein